MSSNAGGLSEVNEEGVSGYLCSIGDVQTMAEKAIYILSDKDRLAQFKQNARKVAARFDEEKIIPMYEALYYNAIKRKNKILWQHNKPPYYLRSRAQGSNRGAL